MTKLDTQKCIPCSIGTEKLQREEIENYLKSLSSEWELVEDTKLRKSYSFRNFSEALEFTNRIGEIAEQEGHHPDIQLSWGKVIVELYTHKIGGLHVNDFILAAKIDAI